MEELRVNEIFTSIQGEGCWTGIPATFIRLQGCNLTCPWCDTKKTWAMDGGMQMTVAEVAKSILRYKLRDIIITGGEPMLQQNGIAALIQMFSSNMRYRFHMETNGTIDANVGFISRLHWLTVSPKPPDHGICRRLSKRMNELKFIITRRADFAIIGEFMKSKLKFEVLSLQPVDNDVEIARQCVTYIVSAADPRVRLSMQLHKFINVP